MKYFGLVLLLLLITACPSEKGKEKPSEEDSMNNAKEMTEEKTADEGESTIKTEEVNYTANGVDLKGYIAYDSAIEGKRPGIIVVHEWWGLNDYARKRARMLAKLGYTAFAIDMYGEGKNTEHPEDAKKFMMQVMDNIQEGESRFNAALDLFKQHPTVNPEKIGAIGYCFGGGIVLHMAKIGTDLDGVMSFHGVIPTMYAPKPGEVKAKVLVAQGDQDQFVTQETMDEFKKQMDAAKADYKINIYEGASHSFTNPDADKYSKDLPIAYNKEADMKSWEDMKEFFNGVFGK